MILTLFVLSIFALVGLQIYQVGDIVSRLNSDGICRLLCLSSVAPVVVVRVNVLVVTGRATSEVCTAAGRRRRGRVQRVAGSRAERVRRERKLVTTIDDTHMRAHVAILRSSSNESR